MDIKSRLLAGLAGLAGLAAGAVPFSALAGVVGSDGTIPFDSALHSDACNGSCVSLMRSRSQLLLQVRDPATGELFRVLPLDADAGATIGAPSKPVVFALQGDEEPAGGPSTGSIPDAPPGGSGVVRETSPFSDRTGSGELEIVYTFVDGLLSNVEVIKTYVHYMPR